MGHNIFPFQVPSMYGSHAYSCSRPAEDNPLESDEDSVTITIRVRSSEPMSTLRLPTRQNVADFSVTIRRPGGGRIVPVTDEVRGGYISIYLVWILFENWFSLFYHTRA